MISNRHKHTIDSIFPIVLFFIFALLALMVMLFAAGSYEKTAGNSLKSNSCSTALSYVTEKIHAGDVSGCVEIGSFDGCNALIIKDSADKNYVTYIYEHDGNLKELYTAPNTGATARSGKTIVQLSAFDARKSQDGAILITCTDADGNALKSSVYLRSN